MNSLMQIAKSTGGNPSILKIKNNIFYKEGAAGAPHLNAIKFANMSSTEIDTSRLNYNLYYYAAAPDSNVYLNFYQSGDNPEPWNYYSPQGVKANPLFAQENYKYRLKAISPAKNLGTPLAEITEDIEEIKRPYWKNGVDAGAYEVPEAQLKIGASGVTQGTQITHFLKTFGTYWERENNSYPIQGSSQLTTSYQTIGNDSTNKEYWGGFHLDWMRNTGNESSMTHAFFKVYNDSSDACFYLDMRDAVYNYSPLIYVSFNLNENRYKVFKDTSFQNIANGAILRVWQLKNSDIFYTDLLSSYNDNCLIPFISNNHPLLIWGPFGTNEFNIERNYDNEGYEQIAFVSEDYEFIDEEITLALGENEDLLPVLYKITSEEYESNELTYFIEKQKKISSELSQTYAFELLQNYPNPFNPSTTITFSLAKTEDVNLKLYDVLGREIKTLVNEKLESGTYNIKLNMSNLASGIYIYRLDAGKFSSVKKMQLIK